MALLFGLTLTDHGNYSTNQPLPIMRYSSYYAILTLYNITKQEN